MTGIDGTNLQDQASCEGRFDFLGGRNPFWDVEVMALL